MQNDLGLYYLDTSVWINLFKKEERNGISFWKIAESFIAMVKKAETSKIIVSSIVIKELSFKLEKSFDAIRHFFKAKEFIILTKAMEEDYSFARGIEKTVNFEISFCDCLHIAIAKRFGAILVTRDNGLLRVGSRYVAVGRPEELIY